VSQKVRKKWVKEGWVSSGRALAWHAQGSRFHHQHHRKKKGSQEEREGKGAWLSNNRDLYLHTSSLPWAHIENGGFKQQESLL
jgi:hypothetical protein